MGAPDLLLQLHGAGFTLTPAEGGGIRVAPAGALTDDHRQAIRAHRAELLVLLSADLAWPYKLTAAQADHCHAEPWNDATCAQFVGRVGRFLRLGIDATDADDLAERLVLRDREGEDVAMCLECRNLSGRATTGWRCRATKAAGVGPELPFELALRLQRCDAFHPLELADSAQGGGP